MYVPHRYDLADWSCVNTEVKTFDRKLEKLMKTFKHVVTIMSCPGVCRGWSSTKLYPDKHGRGVLRILGPLGNVTKLPPTYILVNLV